MEFEKEDAEVLFKFDLQQEIVIIHVLIFFLYRIIFFYTKGVK